MVNLLRNLGYSLRRVSKNPGLTLIVLLTLALGIGANTAMFTVDYASMIAPLPYPNPDQLVMVWSKVKGSTNGVSPGDFLDWRQQSTAFQALNAYSQDSFNLATREQPEYVRGSRTTPGFYRVLGTRFYMGRDFLPEEEQPGRDHVVILTYTLWQHLGADPKILGKSIRLNDEAYTVVGVWAYGAPDRGQMQLDVPLAFKPDELSHDARWLAVMGRLKPGVTIQQGQADMDRVTALIAKAYPNSNKGWGATLEPVKNQWFPKETRLMLWLLLGGMGFILLIACANVANLLLASGMSRQKEFAVRVAVGATVTTIFAQQLTESLVVSLVGGLLGVGVGDGILRVLVSIMPPILPGEADLRLNPQVLIFSLAVATVAGLLFGCVPAWYASRVDPGESLKEGGRSGTGKGRHRLRRILVVGEFALALALLSGAGLAIHSFWNLRRLDLGVRTDHVLTFLLPIPEAQPTSPQKVTAYYQQMLDSIRAVPGVSHVAVTSARPIAGEEFVLWFSIAGKPDSTDPSQRPETVFRMVSPDYFNTFGIRLVRGRGFTEYDSSATVKVAMVSESFAKQFFKGVDPFQQRVLITQLTPGVLRLGPPIEWQIVGIFHDVRDGVRYKRPEVCVPFSQSPWPRASIGVRTVGDPTTMTKSVAGAVHAVDPKIALADLRTMEQVRDDVLANDNFTAILFASSAGLALLLAAVGIYGVMAFSVAQRSHEIGIRLALGAGRDRVVRLIVSEGLMLAGLGLSLGLVGAYFVGSAMQSFLYGVAKMDVSAFGAVSLILLLTALVACFLPARRAAKVDPMVALRYE